MDLLAFIGQRTLTTVPPHRKYGSKTIASFTGALPARLDLDASLPPSEDTSIKSASDMSAREELTEEEGSGTEVVSAVESGDQRKVVMAICQ